MIILDNKAVKTVNGNFNKLKEEAEQQIQRYVTDEKLAKALEKTTLIKLIVIFSGHEAIYVRSA